MGFTTTRIRWECLKQHSRAFDLYPDAKEIFEVDCRNKQIFGLSQKFRRFRLRLSPPDGMRYAYPITISGMKVTF